MDDNVLTAEEQLKAVLYQFISLYNRWAEDRQATALQGAALAECIKTFSAQVAHFKTYEASVRETIQNSIRADSKNMATFIGGSIQEAAIKEVGPIVKTLNEAVYDAGTTLSRFQSATDLMHWKMMGVAVLSSIIASLLVSIQHK